MHTSKQKEPIVHAGELRHRAVFLQKQVQVKSGVSTSQWLPAFTCWCKAEPLSGREFWQAAAVNRENEVRFTIRYRNDVLPALRILLKGMLYDITSVLDVDSRHSKLEILARRVTDGQPAT